VLHHSQGTAPIVPQETEQAQSDPHDLDVDAVRCRCQ